MESPPTFVEEIEFNELTFHEIVGKGAFGVVSRANFRGTDVAVKIIETESERKAFITELKQLSRVSHPNIVKLYGACTKSPVCLVMEYAEGGSLYNVLHGSGRQPSYTSAHAMSWALQCARGVAYLHNMRPKALIHRDLKPPNLLLILGGTVLKICDFGTACDIQTHMTNNKGSAAWMAPEVFEGCNYSEKCDVFSWGIILWEVITRRKPFDEIGGPAFRIMWAVHNGKRPPPIRNIPKPLDILMQRCWSGNPTERPSMAEVDRVMTHLFQFFRGAEEPLVYPPASDSDEELYPSSAPMTPPITFSNTPPSTVHSHSVSPPTSESRAVTNSDTVKYGADRPDHVPLFLPSMARHAPIVVEEERHRGQQSAPPSLAASRESLHDPRGSRSGTPVDHYKRYSADLSKLDEYDISSQQRNQASNPQRGRGHRRIGSDEYTHITGTSSASSTPRTASPARMPATGVTHCSTYPGQLNQVGQSMSPPTRSISHQPPQSSSWTASETPGQMPTSVAPDVNIPASAMNMVYLSLDHQLQVRSDTTGNPSVERWLNTTPSGFDPDKIPELCRPLAPCVANSDSMAMYEQHCKLAEQYVHVQAEIALLIQRKHELIKEFEQEEKEQQSVTRSKMVEEFTQLSSENESLLAAHRSLKQQVEEIRQNQARRFVPPT
ncbi:mitogen-activated protein kinase kinase kinase 7-like isoform X4 [Haliotis rufescens]|uniref:mitogen-activated protein kinase kinase kinase 7-like isoform X4 n=1 Tax=Haliotis rufescens TaxID=6454 RepID=UPI00201FB26C|nr:mitogen-activated protein kinase kinase kinase 7-like isoform X4 [Haliotis rufescens]